MSELKKQVTNTKQSELAGKQNTGKEQAFSQTEIQILEQGSQAKLTEQGNDIVHSGRQKDSFLELG